MLAVLTSRVPAAERWQTLDHVSELLLAGALIGAGLLFYAHWLINRWSSSSWLVLATVAVGCYLALSSGLALSRADLTSSMQPIGFALLVLVLGLTAPRHPRQGGSQRPLLVGTAAGATTALIVEVTPTWEVWWTTGSVPGLVVVAATSLCGLVLTWSVLTGVGAPSRVRGRVAAVAMLVAASESLVHSGDALLTIAVTATKIGAAVLLLETAQLVAGSSINDLRRAIDNLRNGLERQESDARDERATLHEVRATLSGIAQAIPLLEGGDLPVARRSRLQDMVTSELERLERMVHHPRSGTAEVVDLDRVLERVILRQRVRGQQVLWQPSGYTPVVQPDSLTEILGILLENSRRHAPGATTVVEVVQESDQLAIALSDTGRGVATHLRDTIFDWGVRAPGSPGQGIGLAVARELAVENGGELELAETGGGATFVLTLPARTAERRLSADRGDWDDAFSA